MRSPELCCVTRVFPLRSNNVGGVSRRLWPVRMFLVFLGGRISRRVPRFPYGSTETAHASPAAGEGWTYAAAEEVRPDPTQVALS